MTSGSRPPKVLHLISWFLPDTGGAEIAAHNLLLKQQERGWNPVAVSWWGNWRKVRRTLPYRVFPLLPATHTLQDRARFRRGRRTPARVALQARWLMHLFRPDIWHIHVAYPMGFLFAAYLKRLGARVVTTCQGSDILSLPEHHMGCWLWPEIGPSIDDALRACDGLIAISERIQQEFEAIGIDPERIRRIPNGAGVERIREYPVDGAAVRRRYGLPPQSPLLITVAANRREKNYSAVYAIADELLTRGIDFLWVLVGSGTNEVVSRCPSEPVRRRLVSVFAPADQQSQAGGVGMLPPSAVIELLKIASVYVSVSKFEGLSLAMVEALAAGLPLLAYAAPGCSDVVREGINGYVVQQADFRQMSEYIIQLIHDRDLRDKLCAAGLGMSEAFSWSTIADQHEAFYREIVAGRPPPGDSCPS